ncbi:MAG TPA: DUF6716 putative glycosyltransferase [Microlunatus sp.]
MRVLAVADADSYLKWSAATLDRLPAEWSRRQVLLTSPIAPSPGQSRAATGAPISRLSLLALIRGLRRDPPDVLLLACTGPTVAVLTGLAVVRGPRRPVLVTGLPGISIPASARAVEHRRDCDVLVVHSRREREEFVRLAAITAPGLAVALAGLPFLTRDPARRLDPPGRTDVVFAAQAKVPPSRADREAILLGLAAVRPPGSAVVKVRALAGEQQTHHEEHPYADLWAALSETGRGPQDGVRFAAGSMRTALERARSLVTLSSTAALEAIDTGVPIVVLSDFGVDASLINTVFEDSGCLGDLADVRAGRAFRPDPAWLADNYFHPVAEDDLVERVSELVRQRAAGTLPHRGGRHRWWRRCRETARLLLPTGAARWLRGIRPEV